MSEAALWNRIRNAVGHRGHFSRVEFNPSDGYPDLSYCIKGIEGHLELKYIDRAPVRVGTPCFGDQHGMRDAQVAWIHTRLKHGGRVYIGGGVGDRILLVPGTEVRRFNQMTYFELARAGLEIGPGGWDEFLGALKRPMPG